MPLPASVDAGVRRKKMNPSVYLYNETVQGFEIYLGQCSTLEGLSLLDPETKLVVTEFGATCYKKHGWATEKDIPVFENVGNFISFLKSEGDIGIVGFDALMPEVGALNTHDDAECHFVFKSKHICMSVLKSVAPAQYCDMFINKLVGNPGLYLMCSKDGNVTKYSSFNEYVTKNA